ncbi:hypothetical protein EBR57_01445 [bacterium]|nr:hypothetical protein [bacterium]
MKRALNNLSVRVIIAIILGIIIGAVAPEFASKLKILGDTFVRLVKMVIPAIVFLSIASGIGHMTDMKKLVAYSSVSHLGFVVLGLCALNREGLTGSGLI